MTFTVKEIEDQARLKLLDTYEDNYRFAPKEMFLALRDGMRFLRNIRPESKYVAMIMTDKFLKDGSTEMDFVIPESFSTTELAAFRAYTVNMDDRWMEPLVYYVVYQMYLKDDSDTANAALAQTYYQKFVEGAKS